MKRLLLVLALCVAPLLDGHAAIEAYTFETPEQEQAFHSLSAELRCLVCQNQSIGDSNADLAQDLRREIYGMLKAGKDKQAIVDFMVERYGNFVLYRPPVEARTWGLWFGPFLLLAVGVAALLVFVRRRAAQAAAGGGLDAQERERLARLLNEDEKQR